jgi:thioredoxin reductase
MIQTPACYNAHHMYDLTIIGGGPAGVSAGVYAARKRLKTLFLTLAIVRKVYKYYNE